MPFATFTRVREVSSEDNLHLAENLIKTSAGKKWKTKNPGEKSAYVILELMDSYQITGIDIGNEHSAFVEVLVGKSSCAPEEFKEILITCSFMTPIESKNSTNINRVRCFNHEALVPTVAEGKWSLVKILCTQPFNKHVSYGLSFIKIHIKDNTNKASAAHDNLVSQQASVKTIETSGKLKFRKESTDSEPESSSSLFSRWKNSKNNTEEPTTAASIRMASNNPTLSETRRLNHNEKPKAVTPKVITPKAVTPKAITPKANDKYLDRNRENLLFGEEPDDINSKNAGKLERLSEQIEVDKKRRRAEKEKETNKKARKSLDCSASNSNELQPKPTTSKTSINNLENIKTQQNSSQTNSIKKAKACLKTRPFNELLKDVVLVISGIQNPDRAEIRSKALALGAKYKADWDSTCTHLICAFKNTPKYNQVKGKGKIITRSWIEKCYSLKKYLPWRRYAIDSNELSQPESDEELFCESQISQNEESENSTDLEDSNARKPKDNNNTLALYDIDVKPSSNNSAVRPSSESDTDDEIQRVEQNIKMHQNVQVGKRNSTSKTVNIYEASTDEEDYLEEKLSKETNSS